MKAKCRVRKPGRYDAIATSAAEYARHQHTVTINSRRRVLEFEGCEVERAIVALNGALTNRKRRKAEIAAMLAGLASVVEKR